MNTNPLKSRKLWVTVIAGAVITVSDAIGLNLDPETIYSLVGLAIGYNVGNGIASKIK